MRGEEDVGEKYQLKSEQELVSKFLKESLGLYIQQKSREDFGASPEEVIAGVKETFIDLLEGLPDYTKNLNSERVTPLLSAIKDNLGNYIEKIDQELIKEKIAYMAQHPETAPDEAMYRAGHQSKLGKIVKQLENKDTKDTAWKELANLFAELGITKLANFFEQKNEESKMINQAKPMAEALKVLGVHTVSSHNKGERAPVTTPCVAAVASQQSR